MKQKISFLILLMAVITTAFTFNACSTDIISDIISNQISAKDRLDSANAQAKRDYGPDASLVMIYGKNVNASGLTDITAIDILLSGNIDSVGTWLYLFKTPSDTSLRVYAPNPVPGARDCINLTSYFNPLTVLSLIQDTSAANIVQGAISAIINSNVGITSSTNALINSNTSLNLANTSSQIIKFNSNFQPGLSTLNGNTFFQSGSQFERNMFLVPAAGTLNLPVFIQELDIFPQDVWIVNYKKKNTNNVSENLILATVVNDSQIMQLFGFGDYKVINISKFFN